MADNYQESTILFHETVKNLKKSGWTVKKETETAVIFTGTVAHLELVLIGFTALLGPIGLALSLLMIKHLVRPIEVEVLFADNNQIWITGGIGDILVTNPKQSYPRAFVQNKKIITLYTLYLGILSTFLYTAILFAT